MILVIKRAITAVTLMLPIPLLGQYYSTTTTLSITPNIATTQQTVQLTATVTPYNIPYENSRGGVAFYLNYEEDPTAVIPISTTNGQAIETVGPLAAGTYQVVAAFLGSGEPGYPMTGPSSAMGSFTVVAPNAALKGQYAFLFKGATTGSDGASHAAAAVGSFTADGNGNITAGSADFNSSAGSFQNLSLTGSYTLNPATGQGSMTLIDSAGTQTYQLLVPTAQASGTVLSGTFIEAEGGPVSGSGLLAMQSGAAFTAASLAGGYVTNLAGDAACASNCTFPLALFLASSLTLNPDESASSIAAVSVGSYTEAGINSGGTFSTPAATTGRSTLQLTTSVKADPSLNDFVLYPVSDTQLFLMSVDPAAADGLVSGSATR